MKLFFLPILLAFILLVGLSTAWAETTANLLPLADGTEDSSSWKTATGTACNGTNCSTQVNESSGASCSNSDGDTSYVESNTNGAAQTFDVALSSIPDNATITQIDITVCARKSATGAANSFQTRKCINGTCSSSGTNISTGTAYSETSQSHTGLNITKTASTDIEIGTIVTGSVANKVRVSRLATIITYSLPAPAPTPVPEPPTTTPTPSTSTPTSETESTPTPTPSTETSSPSTPTPTTPNEETKDSTPPPQQNQPEVIAEPIVPPIVSAEPSEQSTEEPQKITRPATPAKNSPAKPELRIPLYPDQSRWYNQKGEVIVFWNVPDDITAVAVKLDQNPNSIPTTTEQELLNGKKLGVINEGIWYIHVRFKNNVGFGETTHYKIQLDTTVPLEFKINIDNPISDNPTPTIKFETLDSLSGIGEKHIFLKDFDVIKTSENNLKLPPQPPGKRVVVVRIFDQAGNAIDSRLPFEITPLPSPVIEFLSNTVTHGDVILSAGKALPNSFVDLKIFTPDSKLLVQGTANSDNTGRWSYSFKEPIRVGNYNFTATTRDIRGAQSFPTSLLKIRVKLKPVLSIGSMDLTWPHIFIISLLFISTVGTVSYASRLSHQRTLDAYRTIATRDVQNMTNLLEKSINELTKSFRDISDNGSQKSRADINNQIKNIQTIIFKMRKYIIQGIEKLS